MAASDKDQISTYVDPEVKQKIRMAAASEGESMSDWVRDALMQKLEETDFRIQA